jgi:hypothetical protein
MNRVPDPIVDSVVVNVHSVICKGGDGHVIRGNRS